VHLRRARPTIRLLREDLRSDWESPLPRRHLEAGELTSLHPLPALPHPIIAKALSSFGDDRADDNYVGPIACSIGIPLLEIKAGQWRGGVWRDPEDDVCWILVAGLAKGGHEDHDDFYMRVARENGSGDPTRWLPTAEDAWLLKRERANQLLTDWDLKTQQQVLNALQEVSDGGKTRFELQHPKPELGRMTTATIEVAAIREDAYASDDIVVTITPEPRYAGGDLFWRVTTRILISLHPPEQDWDRFKDTYSNIAEPGHWSDRVAELEQLVERRTLAESVPGQTAHYSHREHIANSVIDGKAMRALCGVFFVNTRLPDELPLCPACVEQWNQLPKSPSH
jgi:hypothetical protein